MLAKLINEKFANKKDGNQLLEVYEEQEVSSELEPELISPEEQDELLDETDKESGEENLQTFIVANADHLVDTDSLSKVVVYQDAHIQKPVYISDVVGFTSDNSVSSLNVELKRLVGQAVFQPKETEEELSAITRFDQLNVTFTNVAIGYKVKSKECITENVTISTNLSTGFGASVYSFPTVNGDSRTSIDVVYLKGGEEVNRIISPLDTGIGFESSKRSTVHMKITDENYLDEPWPSVRTVMYKSTSTQPFTIEVSEF